MTNDIFRRSRIALMSHDTGEKRTHNLLKCTNLTDPVTTRTSAKPGVRIGPRYDNMSEDSVCFILIKLAHVLHLK